MTSSAGASFAPLSIASPTTSNERNRPQQDPCGAATAAAGVGGGAGSVPVRNGYWKTTYRGGFSTSICGLFQDPYDRTSCCALTCCGTFLQDRNTFLLTGERPPAWWARSVMYLGGFVASVLLGLIVPFAPLWFILGMAIRATILRQQTRVKLQEKMTQETRPTDHNHSYTSTRSEHWCCACVSNDKRRVWIEGAEPEPEPPLEDETDHHHHHLHQGLRRQKPDFCFQLWRCLSWSCCDACCFSWWHCCGVCATVQEDRELKRLFPREVFWRDYITFQPFGEYYPKIEWLRAEASNNSAGSSSGSSSSFWNHLGALSELSQKLLTLLQGSLLLLLGAATLHVWQNFNLAKVIVIVATLGQAFLILYVVYWRNHRSDISLDAIIKLFAAGFVLAMTVALLVELILDMIGTLAFEFAFVEEYLDDHPEMLNDNDSDNSNNQNDDLYNRYGSGGYSTGGNNNDGYSTPFDTYDTLKEMAKKHFPTLLTYLFFKAVVVAALVEELTKYFCFWMVEHPDFIYGGPSPEQDNSASEDGEEGAFTNGNSAPIGTVDCQAQPISVPNYDDPINNHSIPPTSPSQAATTDLPPFRPRPTPQHSNAAAAITVGMIATAVGFSCSENLMYVFTQGSVAGEISVLLARSALPIHSICAAIQSIGIARRDVELDPSYQLGRAILPAVALHGIFDFAILVIAFVQFLTGPDPPLGDDGQPLPEDVKLKDQIPAMAVGLIITAIGVTYYVVEAKKQRGRLNALEMTTNEVPTTVGIYT